MERNEYKLIESKNSNHEFLVVNVYIVYYISTEKLLSKCINLSVRITCYILSTLILPHFPSLSLPHFCQCFCCPFPGCIHIKVSKHAKGRNWSFYMMVTSENKQTSKLTNKTWVGIHSSKRKLMERSVKTKLNHFPEEQCGSGIKHAHPMHYCLFLFLRFFLPQADLSPGF